MPVVVMAVGQETAVCAFGAHNILFSGVQEAEQVHTFENQNQKELKDFKSSTFLPTVSIPGAAVPAYVRLL